MSPLQQAWRWLCLCAVFISRFNAVTSAAPHKYNMTEGHHKRLRFADVLLAIMLSGDWCDRSISSILMMCVPSPRQRDACDSSGRDCLRTVGFSLIAMHIMNKTYLLWDIWVGRWVMASLEQTSPRLNADAGGTRNALYDLWRSRLLVIWLVFGSASFVLLAMLSSPVLVN